MVPASGETILLVFPDRRLMREDFPTLGCPKIAILGRREGDWGGEAGRKVGKLFDNGV